MINSIETDTNVSYSPASLVNIFSNTLSNDATKKIFTIKGVYTEGRGMNYGGLYYDSLKDEHTDASITLVVPVVMRSFLTPGKTIECIAYLTKRVQPIGGKIELLVNAIEVLSQQESKYTDEQLEGFELLQKKAVMGYRDVDSFIKTRLINGEPITITILIGKGSIIDSDIKHQLQDAMMFYQFSFVRINLNSEEEIIAAIEDHQHTCDVLIVSRGGGERLEIFNRTRIAECALSIKPYFITAIGHKEDISLLQQVADKAFITPTALGQYFNTIYNDTIEELQRSKAKLVDNITKHLQSQYEKQVTNLREQIAHLEELHKKTSNASTLLNQKELSIAQTQLKDLQQQHQYKQRELQRITEENNTIKRQLNTSNQKSNQTFPALYIYIIIIVALGLGLFLGKML